MTDQLIDSSREVLAHHAKTFSLAAFLLPKGSRDDAAVAYAFCREVDDLADEAPDPEQAHRDLSRVLSELQLETAPSPLVAKFRDIMGEDVGIEPARQLIIGALSDLEEVRMRSRGELLRYCYRVAGTVGLMMCAVLGIKNREAQRHAIDLGIGMQLTNISRDVLEDARNGRTYLPEDLLRGQGTSPDALLREQPDREATARVVRQLLELAEVYYASGEEGLRYIPLRSRLAIVAASRMYRQIGRRLLRNGADAWAGRTIVPMWEKMWSLSLGLGVFVRSLFPSTRHHHAVLHRELQGLPGVANSAASLTNESPLVGEGAH